MFDTQYVGGAIAENTWEYLGLAGSIQWIPWCKPRGRFEGIELFTLGAGGGGGGGFTGAASSARGGGGGGGSGAMARCIIPYDLVPDILYLQPGVGGIGGGNTVAGTAGTLSQVAVRPNAVSLDVILISGNANAGGGGAGSAAAVGAAGAAGTVAVQSAMILSFGIQFLIAGQAGGAGGAIAGGNGTAVAFPTTGLRCMGGTGGGGTTAVDFAGGVITASASLVSDVRPVGSAAGGNNGSDGYLLRQPFWSYPGQGGGSSNSGTAGVGGRGGPGSGGGGGGAGATSGRGGDGGPGLILVRVF
jgi:hypothetical protein